jgi:hypothetical protein
MIRNPTHWMSLQGQEVLAWLCLILLNVIEDEVLHERDRLFLGSVGKIFLSLVCIYVQESFRIGDRYLLKHR